MGGSREEIRTLLRQYREMGCRRLVALRGDMPSGMATLGEIRYASDLVEFIRTETGEHFHIEVACYPEVHPQSDDSHADLKHFKTKVEAGANGAITQYFYNADAYFHFVDAARKAGIDVPIVPGIMPIGNFTQLRRFSDLCGAEIPRWLAKRLSALGDDDSRSVLPSSRPPAQRVSEKAISPCSPMQRCTVAACSEPLVASAIEASNRNPAVRIGEG